MARMSQDALNRAVRINSLLARWRKELAGVPSKVPGLLVEILAENPYWTIPRVAERLGVAFTTAQRAVERLEGLAILRRTSDAKRGRAYCATEILEIFEEPTNLNE